MTKELKNLYETLIDQLIIDNIIAESADDEKQELREWFDNAAIEDKRMAALAIIEEFNVDNRKLHSLLFKKMKESTYGDNYNRMSYIKAVVRMLREYVNVGKEEVKKFGEVMTPIELVEKMLDTLPYEVWSNPDLKWLDPANGVGIFPAVIVERLMKGLSKAIPDQKERYKHIVENMIYVCELQHKNLFLHLCAFDPKDLYASNVYLGSYLDKGFDKHALEVWGVEKFDVIVMNPPYNSASKNIGRGHTLWDRFVIKAISQLVEAGYLVAVHPDGWRAINTKSFKDVQALLKSKQILSLKQHNKYDGQKTFGASTAYDFYCLQNVEPTMFTNITCQDGKIERVDITQMLFIPNGMFDAFDNLLAKNGEETVELLYSRSAYGTDKKNTSKILDDEFKYPLVYVTYKDGSVNFQYSNTKENGHFGLPKVIFSNGISHPIIDEIGEYGLTEFAYAIVDEPKNLFFIQRALLNPEFIKLMSFTDGNTGTGHRYNRKVISMFRKNFWEEFQPA